MQVVAPCVADHGLVISDRPPRHALIDPTGVLIPPSEFKMIDIEGWSPSWLWVTNSAHTHTNSTAAFLNRILFGVEMFGGMEGGILKHAVFLPKDAAVVDYIRRQVDSLQYYNNHTLQSVDHPVAFQLRYEAFRNSGRRKIWSL